MSNENLPDPADDRLLGGLTVAAAVLSVFVMAHHPTGYTPGGLGQFVHGALMILILIILAGVARLAARLGLSKALPLIALIAYGAGTAGNLIAATMNGFVAPALAQEDLLDTFGRFAWEFDQAIVYAAAFSISGAIVLLGVALLHRRAAFTRLAGVAALAAGLAPIALLGFGVVGMNVAGAIIVYGCHSAFALLAGLLLLRRW